MTNIDFYILSSNQPEHRLRYACLLVEQEYRQGKRVYINATNEQESEQLDEQLWSFRDNSFLPHDFSTTDSNSPITIGYSNNTPACDDVMVNLSYPVPEYFSRFHQVKEIVIDSDDIKSQTRDNFRYYKDRGYPLQHHNINADTI